MASIQASPQKTWAVVVGIDRYEAGSEWNLAGPVNDARAFVEWLLGRGVPAEQILLFLSPNSEHFNGIRSHRADVDSLHNVFERELPKKSGDLLIVFWGGHGAIDGDRRLLFCADTNDRQKYNLDLNDLLLLLRTNTYPSLDRQIVFVDACANYLHWMDEPAKLPKREFGKGRREKAKQQFVLYAAADGEGAGDDGIEKTGAFSRVILDWLKKNADKTSTAWPPDLESLKTDLSRHFADLRNQGKIHQTPIWIQSKTWDGVEENLFGDPEDVRERTKRMAEIRDKMKSVAVDTATWHGIYAQVIEYVGRDFGPVHSRDAMVRNLGTANSEPDMPEPIYEFLWRAGTQLDGMEGLREFAEEKIGDDGKIENLRNRVRDEQNEIDYYLQVELVQSASTKRSLAKSFQWWIWHDGRKRPIEAGCCDLQNGKLDDFKKMLIDLLGNSSLQRAQTVHLEIFLDEGMMLRADLAIDRWVHRKTQLGALYPIALRRPMQHPSREEWKKQVRKIRKNHGLCENPVVHWMAPEHESKIALAFSKKDCGPIFGIGVEPKKDFLRLLLQCGAPFLFWPRKTPQTEAAFKATMEASAGKGALEQFPLRVKDLREEALDDITHPGASLALVWDDPDRIPVTRGFMTNE